MAERKFINEDGSIRAELLAERRNALANSAQTHGVDGELVAELLEQVHDRGYVIIPELMPEDVLETILGREILDEVDTVADLRELAKQLRDRRTARLGGSTAPESPGDA